MLAAVPPPLKAPDADYTPRFGTRIDPKLPERRALKVGIDLTALLPTTTGVDTYLSGS